MSPAFLSIIFTGFLFRSTEIHVYVVLLRFVKIAVYNMTSNSQFENLNTPLPGTLSPPVVDI